MLKKIFSRDKTLIMGILNVTPDSFYDGGKNFSLDKAAARAGEIEKEGADILDIGGESSRPGSDEVSQEEEVRRVIPVLHALKGHLHIPVSLDTSRSRVLEKALKTGMVSIVNDIYACRRDPRVAELAAEHGLALVLMHMQGNPKTMQENPRYSDVISEIMTFFEERISFVTTKGVRESRIILDPGIGFGKRLEDNLLIIKNIPKFKSFGCPVLLGPSRKSFIGMLTGRSKEERLSGTSASVACC
ncbi:MAG: dihydropteroate synthase, partial [Candidatus Aureabacteria bacterium]|nr:dihydropteroate synthase [Candidatus Auribacterota bacterium]